MMRVQSKIWVNGKTRDIKTDTEEQLKLTKPSVDMGLIALDL